MRKKGDTFDQLSGLVIGLVIIGIVLVIGLLIMAQTKTQVATQMATQVVVNESVTWTNNTLKALTYTPSNSYTLTCSAVYNGTGGKLIGNNDSTGNYSCGLTGIKIVNQTASTTHLTSPALVSYTCQPFDAGYNATTTTQISIGGISGWLPIIIIIIIGSVLIGLVMYFRREA